MIAPLTIIGPIFEDPLAAGVATATGGLLGVLLVVVVVWRLIGRVRRAEKEPEKWV